jgi:hypothetical protein
MDQMQANHYWDAPIHNMFHADEPTEVLRKNQEADARSKAMLAIKEPKRNGGTDAEQDEMLQLLATAATSDKQPYCRMCALKTLGSWEDPRTAQIILAAYQNAPNESPLDKTTPETGVVQAGRRTRSLGPVSSYTADLIITIRCQALESLGKKRTAEGLALLCQVASTPAKRDVKSSDLDMLTPGNSGQDQQDLRLAAIRALANFKGDIDAAQTLYRVMKSERDAGLKSRAYLSLVEVTGQSYKPDAPEWPPYLHINDSPPPAAPAANSGIQQVGAVRPH